MLELFKDTFAMYAGQKKNLRQFVQQRRPVTHQSGPVRHMRAGGLLLSPTVSRRQQTITSPPIELAPIVYAVRALMIRLSRRRLRKERSSLWR